MFEIRPGQHRPRNVRNGAIFSVLVLLFVVVLYVKPTVPGFGKKGQEVTVDLATGINVRTSTPVRVQGVDVGTVTKVDRGPGGKGVRVTFLVEDGKGVKVHKDASVSFRWRTLLGRNLYADLKPGSPSAPLITKSDVIPQSRTEVQTELDNAVEPFDATGREAVKTIIAEFDKGFGSASAYKRTVRALGPAMKSLGPGLRSIRGTEDGDLQKMITGTSRVLGSLARSEQNLGELIDNGNVALGVTAARRADLQGLLTNAPGALSETRLTMARLRTTLNVLDPVAQDLRPGSRKLEGSADDASTLLNAATPLLADAKPTVRALKPAVQDLTKLTTSGNALFAAANPVLDNALYPILPFLRTTGKESNHKIYEMVGPTLSSADAVAALGDQYGTHANFEAGVGESAIPAFSPCQTDLTNPASSLDEKVNCDAAFKLVTSLLTGAPLSAINLRGKSVTSDAKVDDLLKSSSVLKEMTKNAKGNLKLLRSDPKKLLDLDQKEAGR
jgi:virulence factor Mce-like protein